MKHNKTLSKILASSMILSSIATPVSAASWWDKLVDTEESLKDIVTDIVDTVVDVVESEQLGGTSDFLEDAKDVIEDVAADVESEFSDWYEGEEDREQSQDTSTGKDILEDALADLVDKVETELENSDIDYKTELEDLLDYVTSEDSKDKMEEVLGDVVDALGSIDKEDLENATDALEELVTGDGALSDTLLGSLGLSDDELSDLKDFYEENKEELDDLRDYASNSYEDVVDKIEKLDKGDFNTAWEQLEDSLKELAGGGTSTSLSDTLSDLAQLIEASVEIGVTEELFDKDNQKILADALNQISNVLYQSQVEGELSEVNGVLSDILNGWIEDLGGTQSNQTSDAKLKASLEAVYDILASFVEAVEADANQEIDALKGSGQDLLEEVEKEVSKNQGLFGSITDFVQGVFSDINKYINDKNNSGENDGNGDDKPEITPPVNPAPPAGTLPEIETGTPSSSDKTIYESKTERTVIYHENGCVTIVLTNENTGSLRKITRMPDGVVLLQTYKEGVVYVSLTGVKGEVELYLPYDLRPLSTTKVLQSDVEGKYHGLSSDLVGIHDDALTISVDKNFSLQIHDSYEVK